MAKFYASRKLRLYESSKRVKLLQKDSHVIKCLQALVSAYAPAETPTDKHQERVISRHKRQISLIEASKSPQSSHRRSGSLRAGYYTDKGFKIEKHYASDVKSSPNKTLRLNKSASLLGLGDV